MITKDCCESRDIHNLLRPIFIAALAGKEKAIASIKYVTQPSLNRDVQIEEHIGCELPTPKGDRGVKPGTALFERNSLLSTLKKNEHS